MIGPGLQALRLTTVRKKHTAAPGDALLAIAAIEKIDEAGGPEIRIETTQDSLIIRQWRQRSRRRQEFLELFELFLNARMIQSPPRSHGPGHGVQILHGKTGRLVRLSALYGRVDLITKILVGLDITRELLPDEHGGPLVDTTLPQSGSTVDVCDRWVGIRLTAVDSIRWAILL